MVFVTTHGFLDAIHAQSAGLPQPPDLDIQLDKQMEARRCDRPIAGKWAD
jgi:hypothetical protein